MKSSILKSIAIVLTLAIAPLTISTAQAAVKVGFYVGTWKQSTSYGAGDLITYSNKTFISLVAKNKAKDPIKNPKFWQVLGGVGADGVAGVTGPQGLPGVQGVAGAQGAAGTKGIAGAKGDPGAVGAAGPQGSQGPAGTGPVGTATGDMQWWNGIAWVMIGVGANNTTLKNCDGVPTWVVGSCPFLIGDTGPAGGKVFYLTDATGKHGLEAAPVDQSSGIQWGCNLTVVGGTSRAIGTGKANTAAINAQCGTGTAASIAASYSLNGYSDWYLPSDSELDKLYYQRDLVGGGFAWTNYWSSSEGNANSAWLRSFYNGYWGTNYKDNTFPVRAIRSF